LPTGYKVGVRLGTRFPSLTQAFEAALTTGF
jgi:hypothetical protein